MSGSIPPMHPAVTCDDPNTRRERLENHEGLGLVYIACRKNECIERGEEGVLLVPRHNSEHINPIGEPVACDLEQTSIVVVSDRAGKPKVSVDSPVQESAERLEHLAEPLLDRQPAEVTDSEGSRRRT